MILRLIYLGKVNIYIEYTSDHCRPFSEIKSKNTDTHTHTCIYIYLYDF